MNWPSGVNALAEAMQAEREHWQEERCRLHAEIARMRAQRDAALRALAKAEGREYASGVDLVTAELRGLGLP